MLSQVLSFDHIQASRLTLIEVTTITAELTTTLINYLLRGSSPPKPSRFAMTFIES